MRSHERAPGAAGTGGGDQAGAGSDSSLPPTADIPLHERLLAAGIPVVVCRPHKHWAECRPGCDTELTPETGWQTITVENARELIAHYRPGVDTLAMVGGHGIDVLDVDAKAGASAGWVPDELRQWGCTISPSGGWHFPVPSTGYGKGDLILGDHGYAGDYVGGTPEGGGRLLCFLPGSARPKYPGKGYLEAIEWDIDRLLDTDPPDILINICERSKLSRNGAAGQPAAPRQEVQAFLDGIRNVEADEHGRQRLEAHKDKVKTVKPGDSQHGRHNWAIAAAAEAVELARVGCIGADNIEELRETLDEMKPGSAGEWWQLIAWSLTNATGTPDCPVHGWPSVGPWKPDTDDDPEDAAPTLTIDAAREVFRYWLGDNYDLDAMTAAVAVAACVHLDGDTPWLLVVSGSGFTKTETVSALAGAGAHVTSTITSEGALLSATSKRERTKNATGGLLRAIGDSGVLVIKDVTSILSMGRELRSQVLAALREVADGYWERNVGTDGGQTLTWSGRCVTVGAVTTAWDKHHQVVAEMGDRFLLVRMDSDDADNRDNAGRQALLTTSQEKPMRAALREAVAGLIAGMDPDRISALTDTETGVLLGLADVAARCRTAVERDGHQKPEWAHALEAPTRLAKYLWQLVRGAVAIGVDRDDAMRLAARVAADCMPPLRKRTLLDVRTHPRTTVAQTASRLQLPWSTVDRAMQELHLLGAVVAHKDDPDSNKGWRYTCADAIDQAALDLMVNPSGYEKPSPEKSVGPLPPRESAAESGDPAPPAPPVTDISGETAPTCQTCGRDLYVKTPGRTQCALCERNAPATPQPPREDTQ